MTAAARRPRHRLRHLLAGSRAVKPTVAALRASGLADAEIVAWWSQPRPELDGDSPRTALRDGRHQQVLRIARATPSSDAPSSPTDDGRPHTR